MKKTFLVIAILLLSAVAVMFSCDRIEGEYYNVINNEDVDVAFPDLDPSSVYRKMLIDEFTGHYCVNCPQGHETLENLHQRYGDTLVMIGIHYGTLAKPMGTTFTYDFRTDVGTEIGNHYQINGIPVAIVNREFKAQGYLREEWASAVAAIDRSKVPVALQMINQHNASSKKLKANVKVTFLEDYASPLTLLLYVIEDNVIKPQKNGTETIMEYNHKHVLRAAFGPTTDGYVVNASAASAGESITYASTLDYSGTDWNAENCSVVAVLFDKDKSEVVQVEQLKF